jgi:hypothetical protein
MRRIALVAALLVSGCIDADVALDFTDPDTMLGLFDITLSRQLHDMTGGAFCKDGIETLTPDTARCTTERRVPLADVLEKGTAALGEGQFAADEGLRIETIDDNRLRVSFDFSKMPQKDQPQDLQGMDGMVRAALAGHSFVFRIKAYRILSSTGTISADGSETTKVIPVTAFLDQPPSVGGDFVTELQLRQVCRFWVFCD